MGAVSSYTIKVSAPADYLLGTDSGGVVKRFSVGDYVLNPNTGSNLVRIENTGSAAPAGAAGQGLELIGSGGGISYVQAYNRTTSAFAPMAISSSLLQMTIGGVAKFTIQSTSVTSDVGLYVPDVAYSGSWDADLSVPTKNAVYDKIETLADAAYRTIIDSSGSHTAARAAGTYWLGQGDAAGVTGTGTLYPPNIIYIDSADFPNTGSKTFKLRLRVALLANDVAPTGNYTFGLYPITRPATSGGAGLDIITMGTVIAGSTVAVNTPAADSINNAVGSDFSVPTAGFYVLGFVSTAAVATSSHLHISAALQGHYG